MSKLYKNIRKAQKLKKPKLAVLIDPDKYNPELVILANTCRVSYFFVGGSRLTTGNIHQTIKSIKKLSRIPVIIFPGDETQLDKNADGLLFLSLLSGRNPDYLIGKQVLAAPFIKKSKLECISTAYILIEGKKESTTQKISQTKPLTQITQIVHTAMASELLGFKTIYLEAGSGARQSIKNKILTQVRKNVKTPIIAGGGIDTVSKAQKIIQAGADILVIGNALEKNKNLLKEFSLLFK